MQDVEKIAEEKVLGRPLAFRVTLAKPVRTCMGVVIGAAEVLLAS